MTSDSAKVHFSPQGLRERLATLKNMVSGTVSERANSSPATTRTTPSRIRSRTPSPLRATRISGSPSRSRTPSPLRTSRITISPNRIVSTPKLSPTRRITTSTTPLSTTPIRQTSSILRSSSPARFDLQSPRRDVTNISSILDNDVIATTPRYSTLRDIRTDNQIAESLAGLEVHNEILQSERDDAFRTLNDERGHYSQELSKATLRLSKEVDLSKSYEQVNHALDYENSELSKQIEAIRQEKDIQIEYLKSKNMQLKQENQNLIDQVDDLKIERKESLNQSQDHSRYEYFSEESQMIRSADSSHLKSSIELNKQMQDKYDEMVAEKNSQIKKLELEIKTLQLDSKMREEEAESQKKTIASYQRQNQDLTNSARNLEEIVRKLKGEIKVETEMSSERIENLKAELETTTDALERIEEEHSILLTDKDSNYISHIEEIQMLTDSVQQLTKEKVDTHERHQSIVQNYEIEIRDLRKKIDELHQATALAVSSQGKTQIILQEKEKELQVKADQCMVLTNQYTEIEKQYNVLLHEKYSIETEYEKLKTKSSSNLEEQDRERKELKRDLEEAQRLLLLAKNEAEDQTDKYNSTRDKLDEATTSLTKFTIENEQLRTKSKSLAEQLDSLRKEKSAQDIENQQLIDDLTLKLTEANENQQNMLLDLEKQRSIIEELEERKYEIQKDLQSYERRVKETTEIINTLRAEITSTNERGIQKQKERENEKKQLENFIAQLRADNDNLRQVINNNQQSNEAKFNDVEYQYMEYEKIIGSLKNELQGERDRQLRVESGFTLDIENLKSEKSLLETQMSSLKQQIKENNDISRQREEKLVKEKTIIEAKIRANEEEIEKLKAANGSLKDANADLQKQLRRSLAESEEAIRQLRDSHDLQISEMYGSRKNLETRYKLLKESKIKLRDELILEVRKLKSAIDDRDAKIAELRTSLDSISDYANKLSQQVQYISSEYISINENVLSAESFLAEQSQVLRAELEVLLIENESLKKKQASQDEQLEITLKNNTIIKEELEDLKKQRDETQKKNSSLSAQNKSLEDKLKSKLEELTKEKDQKISTLEAKFESLRENHDSIRAENDQLKNKVDHLKKVKQDLLKEISETSKQMNDAKRDTYEEVKTQKTTIVKLNSTVKAQADKLDSLQQKYEQEIKQAQEQIQSLKKELFETADKCDTIARERDEALLKVTEIELNWKNKVAEVNNHISSIEDVMKAQDKQTKEQQHILEMDIQTKITRINSLESEIKNIKNERENLKNATNQEKEELRSRLKRAERSKQQLEQNLEALDRDCNAHKKRAAQLVKEIEESSAEKSQLNAQLTASREEIEALKSGSKQREKLQHSTILQLQEQLAQAENIMTNLKAQRKTLQQDNAQLSGKFESIVAEYRRNIEDLKKENAKLRKEVEIRTGQSIGERRDFELQISQQNTEINNLTSKYQQLVSQYQSLKESSQLSQSVVKKSQIEFNNLAAQLQKSEASLREQEGQKKALRDEIAKLNLEIQSIREISQKKKQLEVEIETLRTENLGARETTTILQLKLDTAEQERESWKSRYESIVKEKKVLTESKRILMETRTSTTTSSPLRNRTSTSGSPLRKEFLIKTPTSRSSANQNRYSNSSPSPSQRTSQNYQ